MKIQVLGYEISGELLPCTIDDAWNSQKTLKSEGDGGPSIGREIVEMKKIV